MPAVRALLAALDDWVAKGTAPRRAPCRASPTAPWSSTDKTAFQRSPRRVAKAVIGGARPVARHARLTPPLTRHRVLRTPFLIRNRGCRDVNACDYRPTGSAAPYTA